MANLTTLDVLLEKRIEGRRSLTLREYQLLKDLIEVELNDLKIRSLRFDLKQSSLLMDILADLNRLIAFKKT